MTSVARVCSVEGCDRPHESLGFCNAHYKRHRKRQDMSAPVKDISSKRHLDCEYPECRRPQYCKGLCTGHYQRMRQNVPMGQPWQEREEGRTCSVPGCDRGYATQGYCGAHLLRLERGQDLTTPLKPLNPKMAEECAVTTCVNEVKRGITCTYHTRQAGKYGLEVPEYIRITAGVCDICGDDGLICIDHDHSCCPGAGSCGKCVRGGLCRNCNNAIGLLKENLDNFNRAVEYLSRNRATLE